MSEVVTLPDWKPLIKTCFYTGAKPFPSKLPYITEGRIYLRAGTNDGNFAGGQKLLDWQAGKGLTPINWWCTYFDLGNHPNFDKIPEMLPVLKEMYHASTQLKLALGQGVDPLLKHHAMSEWHQYSKTITSVA
jgi:hypothetical protein